LLLVVFFGGGFVLDPSCIRVNTVFGHQFFKEYCASVVKEEEMQHVKKCYGCRGDRPGSGAVREPKPYLIPVRNISHRSAESSTLQMEATDFSETSVLIYRSVWFHIPED
jgi:hypothetical protein